MLLRCVTECAKENKIIKSSAKVKIIELLLWVAVSLKPNEDGRQVGMNCHSQLLCANSHQT